ncbi:MAG: NfeD family protein [Lachnospiraceae bacterium]
MDYFLILWLVLLIVFVIAEIVTLGLTTIWFAGGALAALLANLAGLHEIVQVALFFVVSILLLALTRPVAIRYLNKDRIKTNAESLIGKTAFVVEQIDNLKAMGCVTVDGQEWTARCESDDTVIEKDALVVIKAIQGVKLIVALKE